MRENLKKARKKAGMTQQQVADKLDIGLRYYKSIESGERLGGIELWDALEDLFSVHQRKLREISTIHPDQEDSR
ncbi:MAG: helix-turn-helix transcriptional regulator [Anaerotignum sp.]